MMFCFLFFIFFFYDPSTTEFYTLSLLDALPICLFAEDHGHAALVYMACLRALLAAAAHHLGRHQAAAAKSARRDRKSTRLNSSHVAISYAVFCSKKKIHTVYFYSTITPI